MSEISHNLGLRCLLVVVHRGGSRNSEKGAHMFKGVGFALLIVSLFF